MERRKQIEIDYGVRLELTGYVSMPPRWIGNFHSHPFWELIFLVDGKGNFEVKGRKALPIKGPGILLVKPGIRHQFRVIGSSSASMLYIGFSCTSSKTDSSLPEVHELEATDPHLLAVAAELAEASEDSREMILTRFKPRLLVIISEIASRLMEQGQGVVAPSSDRHTILVEKIKEYLKAHLDSPVEVSSVGEAFYLSSHYLSDLFKTKTGMSPKQFHNALRMRESNRLLHEEGLSVKETASRLGFKSIHYFSRRFKEFFGHPPTGRSS